MAGRKDARYGVIHADKVVAANKLSVGGTDITDSIAEVAALDGLTATAAELNKLDGATVTVAEINILDGVTATAAEINAVDLSAVGALHKVKKIAISTPADGDETDLAWDLPAKAVVLDVFLDVTTAEATGGTKTLDIGLLSSESGGDADGFLDGADVSAIALVRGVPTYTVGSNDTYFASSTRGALLAPVKLAGADVVGDTGTYSEQPHLSDSVTAKSVSYTAGSADFAELVADLYIVYIELG